MTQEELYAVLVKAELPVTYNAWKPGQTPNLPFIAYRLVQTINFYADNVVYKRVEVYDVELYMTDKDLGAERKLENVFRLNNINFTKLEQPIDSQGMLEVVYTINLMGEING